MDFIQTLNDRQQEVNRQIIETLNNRFDVNTNSVIYQACRYALLAGGKRIRPILLLESAKLFGVSDKDAMFAAIALEFIHTYSLIHDDLPAMDDAARRRGQPTLHLKFGEGMAVLAGDALLTEAFGILADPLQNNLDANCRLLVIQSIATGAGVLGMVGGQELDLLSEGVRIDLTTLNDLHYMKTAAMLEAAVVSGAIIGKASDSELLSLRKYGKAIGLAFQIRDDLLDIDGDAKLMGKDTGQDEEQEKSTYPALIGLEESRKKMNDLVGVAIKEIEQFGKRGEFLLALAKHIAKRKT